MIIFAVTLALIFLVGVPLIKKSVHLPEVMEFKEVPDTELSDKQRIFFEEYDVKMRGLGFSPVTTFTVTNMQNPNLNRAYQSETGSAWSFLTAITSANGEAVSNYLEIVQAFADGTSLTTRNVEMSEVFPRMPMRFRQDLRGADPAALQAAHERWIERERKVPAGRLDRAELFTHIAAMHTEWLLFLESGGYLQRDHAQPVLRATTKTALRGVSNFLNPLADNFTIARFAAGVVLGGSLPLAANVFEADLLAQLTPHLSADAAPAVLYGVAYGLAGAVVGRIFTTKAFLWGFLLGAMPVAAVLGGEAGSLWAELWMGAASHYVSSRHAKRTAIAMAPPPEPLATPPA